MLNIQNICHFQMFHHRVLPDRSIDSFIPFKLRHKLATHSNISSPEVSDKVK